MTIRTLQELNDDVVIIDDAHYIITGKDLKRWRKIERVALDHVRTFEEFYSEEKVNQRGAKINLIANSNTLGGILYTLYAEMRANVLNP